MAKDELGEKTVKRLNRRVLRSDEPKTIRPKGRPAKAESEKEGNYIVESPRDNPETHAIQRRFFEAIDFLKSTQPEFSQYAFAKKYKINRGNLTTMKTSPEKLMLPMLYLHFLVKDYNVSGRFLLTGKGPICD